MMDYLDFMKLSHSEKTYEICLEVIRHPWMLPYVPLKYRTYELCLNVVGNHTHGHMLRYVPEQHKDSIMCLTALKHIRML